MTFKVAAEPTIDDPLDHEYVPPPLAVKVMLVVVHVSILVFGFVLIAAVGF